jgi:hypothetical protein
MTVTRQLTKSIDFFQNELCYFHPWGTALRSDWLSPAACAQMFLQRAAAREAPPSHPLLHTRRR